MSPGRVRYAVALADSLGVLDRLDVVAPPPADDALLATVHTPEYIEAVRRGVPDERYGLGTSDNPVFPEMHEVSSQVVTATVEAARQVWEGRTLRASNIAGGLHHAMPDRTSGFCVYNDVAVAIQWLLDHGVERVAYVDVDVHHGDGVQTVFWDDPRVMTVSLHETPVCLFPGTGFPTEIGGPNALGTAVNVALPPGDRRRRLAAGVRRGRAAGPRGATVRRCWSPSTAATPTATTRSPTSTCPSTGSAPRTWRSRPWPTSSARAAGCRPAAAGTPCCTSCRAPGPICSPSSAASRSTPRRRRRRPGATGSARTPRRRWATA